MAYDEQLADRVRELMVDEHVVEKRMFGGLAFLIGGHMSVAAHRNGGLMVRVEPEETDSLVIRDGVSRFVMRGKEMDGWLLVGDEVLTEDDALADWVERGVTYALGLPPA